MRTPEKFTPKTDSIRDFTLLSSVRPESISAWIARGSPPSAGPPARPLKKILRFSKLEPSLLAVEVVSGIVVGTPSGAPGALPVLAQTSTLRRTRATIKEIYSLAVVTLEASGAYLRMA